jgi:hypothetical protein
LGIGDLHVDPFRVIRWQTVWSVHYFNSHNKLSVVKA